MFVFLILIVLLLSIIKQQLICINWGWYFYRLLQEVYFVLMLMLLLSNIDFTLHRAYCFAVANCLIYMNCCGVSVLLPLHYGLWWILFFLFHLRTWFCLSNSEFDSVRMSDSQSHLILVVLIILA